MALHRRSAGISDPDERCDGINIYSKEVQNEYGFSGQTDLDRVTGIGRNQFTAGAAIDRGSVNLHAEHAVWLSQS